jgi:hypothetical protein
MPSTDAISSPSEDAYDDDRGRRRDVVCSAIGLFSGGGVGLVMSLFTRANSVVFTLIGALAGVIVGRLSALRISADDWDPHASAQPYVGASSPDDDIASG